MHDHWKNLLAPKEEILWQGSPKDQVRLEWENPIIPVFFLFFTGISAVLVFDASKVGGLFWAFGLLFFSFGIFGLIGVHFWKAFVCRR